MTRWAYWFTIAPSRLRDAYSCCASTNLWQISMASSSFLPMRRFRISCRPALVSKDQRPPFRTIGKGAGQSSGPTIRIARSGFFASGITSLFWRARAEKAMPVFRSWTGSSVTIRSSLSGPRICFRAGTSQSPVALIRASAACRGVSKVCCAAEARAGERRSTHAIETAFMALIAVLRRRRPPPPPPRDELMLEAPRELLALALLPLYPPEPPPNPPELLELALGDAPRLPPPEITAASGRPVAHPGSACTTSGASTSSVAHPGSSGSPAPPAARLLGAAPPLLPLA